jgi:hypothetical protein
MAVDPVLLSRYTQDIASDSRIQARYVGNLEGGRSRVSVNSALSKGDRDDYFRFRVTEAGYVRLSTGELVGQNGTATGVAPDGTVRYQILSSSGRVVADSDPKSGAAYAAYQKLTTGDSLQMSKGDYVIRVARDKQAINNQEYVYSFTFKSSPRPLGPDQDDQASREFLTTERPADPSATTAASYNSQGAVLGLFSGVSVSLFA